MRQQFPMQTKAPGNAVFRCSRDWQKKIILAYTGSSPADADLLPAPPHRSGNRRDASGRENPPPFSHSICLARRAENKRGRPHARRIARPLHLVARACTCNGAPERAPRAPPRHTSIYCIEGAAPQSSTGNDGLQLVEGR